VFEIGGLLAVVYANPDFTYMVDSFRQYNMNMTLDSKTSGYFLDLT
jgi:hypothetical protein